MMSTARHEDQGGKLTTIDIIHKQFHFQEQGIPFSCNEFMTSLI